MGAMISDSSRESPSPSKEGHPPSQPQYEPPARGLPSYLPSSILPYAELIRLDKPGFTILFFHIISGALLAALISHVSPQHFMLRLPLLIVAFIPVRFINFAWNDIVDADLDKSVTRTKNRPIARGALSRAQASIFLALLVSLVMGILCVSPLVFSAYAIPITFMTILYPFSKRFMDFPQAIFGLLVAPASLTGSALFGIAPFVSEACYGSSGNWLNCFQVALRPQEKPLIFMFAANVLWATFYETVYSFADVKDDRSAGIRTITLIIRKRAKLVLGFLACIFVLLLAITGIQAQLSSIYYMTTVLGTTAVLAVQLKRVDLDNPRSCLWLFGQGTKYIGVAANSGLLAEYFISVHAPHALMI